MANNYGDYIGAIRVDLDDPNPPAAIWSDTDLQRHINHAVHEYSLWNPLEQLLTSYSLTPGSRTITLSSADLATLNSIRAVEYPTGQWPPAFVQFQLWANQLTLELDGPPQATDPLAVNLYVLQNHAVSVSSCSIPPRDDEAIIAGAVSFAAAEYATKTAGQISVAGPNTWLRYRDLALDKAAEFRGYLQIIRARITPQRAYAPEEPRQSRFIVDAPYRD
jgi:hypothetical protein